MVRINDEDNGPTVGHAISWVFGGIVLVVIIIALFSIFYTIQSGQEGVLLTFNKADPVGMEPGLHFKAPFVQGIVKFDMKTQKFGAGGSGQSPTLETAASSDLQVVTIQLAVNYHIASGMAPTIFTKIGTGYEDTVISPSVHEATKAVTAQFTAADLIDKREEVRADIENLLKEKLAPYNIIVEQVSITNLDFSAQFNQAIEAKVTAVQNYEQAQNVLKTIQVQAQQAIAQADGQRNATVLNAEGQAQAVELVNAALQNSPKYVDYVKATRWNGVLPTVMMSGNGATPFIDISGVVSGATNTTG